MPPRRRNATTGEEQLTLREQLFIEYLAQGEIPTQAAKKAGYAPDSAFVTASQKLSLPSIQQAYQRRVLDVIQSDTQEIHSLLATHLRTDIGDFEDEDFDVNGRPILRRLKQKGLSRTIKKLRSKKTPVRDRDGQVVDYEWTVDLELHDSQAAAAKLMQIFGMAKAPETHPNDAARDERAIKARILELVAGKEGVYEAQEEAK